MTHAPKDRAFDPRRTPGIGSGYRGMWFEDAEHLGSHDCSKCKGNRLNHEAHCEDHPYNRERGPEENEFY